MEIFMVNENKLAKSICLNSQNEMKEICTYLSISFGIEHFSYIKCFSDSTHYHLNTHGDWMEHVYRNFSRRYDVFFKTIDAYSSGVHLWLSLSQQASFVDFKEHSGIDHGIVLIEKQDNYCEFYNFASTSDKPQIINFYLNNLDILWRHTFYFKDRASDLLKKAEEDRFILPKCTPAGPDEKLIMPTYHIDEILKDTSIKRYYLNVMGKETYLTASEAKCCYYLINNKNIKTIASLYNLSPRTVENHINNIKQKLHCLTTADLINKILLHTNFSQIYMK